MSDIKRVLYVNSEMCPYTPETIQAIVARNLPQGVQEKKAEIRCFMPRYGSINERKHQLHEVIRLFGINIPVGGMDRPLVIKVASIPSARMQVYFIDNEDYFHRKPLYRDADGRFFDDNSERAVFFVRGVLETVKKLRWAPDVIHCSGWMSYVLPVFLKKAYKDDPIFSNSKVVVSLYNDILSETFKGDFESQMMIGGITREDIQLPENATGEDLAKLAIRYSDGVIMGEKDVPESLAGYSAGKNVPVLQWKENSIESGAYVEEYGRFYETL